MGEILQSWRVVTLDVITRDAHCPSALRARRTLCSIDFLARWCSPSSLRRIVSNETLVVSL